MRVTILIKILKCHAAPGWFMLVHAGLQPVLLALLDFSDGISWSTSLTRNLMLLWLAVKPALTSITHGLTAAVSYRLLHLSLVGFHLHLESLHQLLHAVLVLLVLLGLEEQLLQTPLVLPQALHRLSVSLLLAVQLQLQLLHLSVSREQRPHKSLHTQRLRISAG